MIDLKELRDTPERFIDAAKAKNIPIIALLFVAGAPNARDVEDKSRSLSAEAVKH